jgi:hypothetical protein
MKHYNLAYLPNEFPKKILGCIAKQATRSMNDLGRRKNCVGQTKHKKIVTKHAAKSGGRNRSRSVVGNTFLASFVHTSETKSNSAMNTTIGGAGLKKKVSKHFVCHCLNCLHPTNKKIKLCISST